MKLLNKFTNGIVLVVLGVMHTHLAFSEDGFGKQFQKFSESYFFEISKGVDELPLKEGLTDFAAGTAFWFFYWGILVIPIGFCVHYVERKLKVLPHSFTISYLFVILIGAYMIPKSGMTFFMLPHAIFMLVNNFLKVRKSKNVLR